MNALAVAFESVAITRAIARFNEAVAQVALHGPYVNDLLQIRVAALDLALCAEFFDRQIARLTSDDAVF